MLIPALDLISGRVVRLRQGDFTQKTEFPMEAIEQAQQYAKAGAEWLHLVDLDGAKDPQQRQTQLLAELCKASGLRCQVGGGIRHLADLEQLFAAGIERVVVGSTAVSEPNRVRQWMMEFGPDAVVLALDVNIDQQGQAMVATHGWQSDSGQTLDSVLQPFIEHGCRHVLCTDISKDGMLSGPNTELYRAYKDRYPQIQWQASGGVASLTDLKQLKQANCDSVILGKSLLSGQFSLEEAIACWQNA